MYFNLFICRGLICVLSKFNVEIPNISVPFELNVNPFVAAQCVPAGYEHLLTYNMLSKR